MAKSVDDLQWRIVPKEEVKRKAVPTPTARVVEELKAKFRRPDGSPIEVGEGVDSGPWETEGEGMTWLKKYIPEMYRSEGFHWDQNKKNKSSRVVTYEPHTEADGVYILVIRQL